jgi:hypothetical protein
MQLQFRAKCTVKDTTAETEILVFEFNLGPIHVVCLANVPREGEKESIAYVKVDLDAGKNNWEVMKG